MPTAATSGYGTLLKIGDGGGPESFTTVAEVVSISGPSLKVDTVDVTSMSSTGAWRERIPTLKDAGEISLDLNFLPGDTTQKYATGLIRDLVNRTKRNFQIVFSDGAGTTWQIAAYVTSFEPSASVDGKLGARVTLTTTGQPTLA